VNMSTPPLMQQVQFKKKRKKSSISIGALDNECELSGIPE